MRPQQGDDSDPGRLDTGPVDGGELGQQQVPGVPVGDISDQQVHGGGPSVVTPGASDVDQQQVRGGHSAVPHDVNDNLQQRDVGQDEQQQGTGRGAVGSIGRGRAQCRGGSGSGRRSSPVSRLSRYLTSIDRFNLYPIPDTTLFQRGEEFTANELQIHGLTNDGNVCPIISIFLSFHRLRLRDHLTDPLLCITDRHRPSLILHKILRALPSQESFSILQFILSWNKEKLQPVISQASFEDVRDLVQSFLSSLAIKSFRTTPVFTKYVLSFNCQVCGNHDDNLEHWNEQMTKNLLVLPVEHSQSEDISLPQIASSFLSRPVQVKCPSIMCNKSIPNAVLKAIPGMFSAIAVYRLSFDRGLGLRKNVVKLTVSPGGKVENLCVVTFL